MLAALQASDPLVQKITAHLRARLPQATAIIFFGSRVAGCADAFSDYDVLVLVPGGLDDDERARVKREMQSAFPKTKLDLVIGSERWLLGSLRIEAYYRFWLENALATFGRIPSVKRYPPLYKDALDSRLNIIGSDIKVVAAFARNLHEEARGYLRILKHLILIEHALRKDYDNRSLWVDVDNLLGADLVNLLRDPRASRRMRRPTFLRVRRVMRRKYIEVRRQVLTAKLPCKYPLPERAHL